MFYHFYRKAEAGGSSVGAIDTIPGSKAYEMIYDIRLTDEQLKENGFPHVGDKPGMAKVYKSPKAAPANEDDRYCRRCGKVYRLDHYDEEAVDQCNYHPKSPGYRRGKIHIERLLDVAFLLKVKFQQDFLIIVIDAVNSRLDHRDVCTLTIMSPIMWITIT